MEQDDAPGRAGTPIIVNIPSGKIDGLHKELEEGQEGEEKGVGGGGGKSLNNATFQDPVEKALTNPVILLNIFSHLEFDALLNLRLVCKAWDEVVRRSPEFRDKFYINVQRLFPCCTVAPVPKINPNLAKNVYITDKCWDKNANKGGQHNPKQTEDAAAFNLTTFFNQYHHYVENIEFDRRYCDSFHTYLAKFLNVLDFSKLQRIHIVDMFNSGSFGYCWNWGEYKGDLNSTFATFLTRPKLTSLWLEHTIAGSPFHDIFQKLINCAPNLEKITINGNFYPDLSTCKNLKLLHYSGIPYYYSQRRRLSEERSFNLESLSKMLDQTKHSLIELSLQDAYIAKCTPSDMDGHSQLEEFQFPNVGKELKYLRIQEISKPFFQSELKKLNPVQFPKLKSLSILVKSVDNILGGISHNFETISQLLLSGSISPNIHHRIRILFPNLTNLAMPWSVGTGDEKPDFDALIDFCSGWKLRELDFGTALQYDWCAFMTGLGRLKRTQKDMKVLKLPSQNSAPGEKQKPVFDLWYDAKKEQHQQVGTMSLDLQNLTFGSQSMQKAVEENVLQFIFDHPLTVHFI